jgi:hypothetical protein
VSNNAFGFTDAAWAAAKKEAASAIAVRARTRGMITYTELVASIEAVRLEPRDQRLDELLRELSIEEHRAGRGMMTALVVHKTGDMEPGPGFFELAERLGLRVTDRTKFWVDQVHKVHRAWEA